VIYTKGYNMQINDHNGFQPRTINIFHNTVLSNSPSGGIDLYHPNTAYQQYCYANAVFCDGSPISGFLAANTVDNVTDSYNNAGTYVNSPSIQLELLDLYPKPGQLQGALTNNSLFTSFTDFNIDFNGDPYIWTFRGAYAGSGINYGWHLRLDTMPTPHGNGTGMPDQGNINDFAGMVYPDPVADIFHLDIHITGDAVAEVMLCDLMGSGCWVLGAGLIGN